jgi:hypothetical protein
MRLFAIVTAALMLLVTGAQAADLCYIAEYNTLGKARGEVPDIAQEPRIASQVTADFTSGAVQSSAFNTTTSFIRLWCNVQASYLIGTNPTAANTDTPIAALTPEYFGIVQGSGMKISVHTNP